ncbi:DNA helicase (plasmid) [Euzebya pacifica]|uniref:DNA helicase n=1 Tax=Euzebya pacifica TaxID=1608957 RepID=A0A346Y750_9ACTN|nr:DNA helicase [Euzebya pacifica]
MSLDPVDAPANDRGEPHTSAPADASLPDRLPPLIDGDVAVKTLASAWAGDPLTMVQSPPGAGKSTLLATVASHLQVRGGFVVGIAAQRTNQAIDLANKLARLAPAADTVYVGPSSGKRPRDLEDGVPHLRHIKPPDDMANGLIIVATSAKWAHVPAGNFRADMLLVDEAWQLRYADWGRIAHVADQYVLVGDPGQIAPVVTCTTRRWTSPTGPQVPAPIAIRHLRATDDPATSPVTEYTLPNTRRCGPATAAVLAPLYPFPFGSARHDRTLLIDGAPAEEFARVSVDSNSASRSDRQVAAAIAERVAELLRVGAYRDERGNVRPLRPDDIGVLTGHVDQTNAVRSHLSGLVDGADEVTVDTADAIQGSEFLVALAWSPVACKAALNDFDLDTGRLCVMLSRHVTHCVWFDRTDTSARLTDAGADSMLYRDVLGRLDATIGSRIAA